MEKQKDLRLELRLVSGSFVQRQKTDRHLSRQKIRQRISVMKTNTLYSSRFSRELAFSFTFCLEVNKNTKITENL